MQLPWRSLHPLPIDGPRILTSLTENETRTLRTLAEGVRVLEIGTACGFSTVSMASVAQWVISVDHHAHINDSLSIAWSNLKSYGFNDRVTLLVGDSNTALADLSPKSFDLIFIDGDHSAQGLTLDVKHALRLIKPSGVLAFHDYGEDTCPDVAPTIDKLFTGSKELVDTLCLIRI